MDIASPKELQRLSSRATEAFSLTVGLMRQSYYEACQREAETETETETETDRERERDT